MRLMDVPPRCRGAWLLAIGQSNEPHQQQDPDAPKEPESGKEEIDRDQCEKTPGKKGHVAAPDRSAAHHEGDHGNDEQATDPLAKPRKNHCRPDQALTEVVRKALVGLIAPVAGVDGVDQADDEVDAQDDVRAFHGKNSL